MFNYPDEGHFRAVETSKTSEEFEFHLSTKPSRPEHP